MSPKRPPARPRPAEISDSDDEPRKWRRATFFSPQSDSSSGESDVMNVYLVQAKLTQDNVTELYALIEKSDDSPLQLQICPEPENADVVVTAIRMKSRLERHIDWRIAKQKAIVTPEWLKESAKEGKPLPCGAYAAIQELEEETTRNCPDPGCSRDSTSKCRRSRSSYDVGLIASLAEYPTPARVLNNWRARYACQRASPLKCPNQGLAEALSVLCRDRELDDLHPNALAYQRAVAIIKSYPKEITPETLPEVSKLPGLGGKIYFKVEEYVEKGSISEVEETLASDRYQALSAFATIYSIGPSKARQYYDMGMRSVADLERYYDVSPPDDDPCSHASIAAVEKLLQEMGSTDHETVYTPNGKRAPSKALKRDGRAPDITIPVALALRAQFQVPIPRAEVEEIRRVIMRELDEIQPGCVSTIVGGYRRGKPQSNDVDIVFSHPDTKHGAEIIKGLCAKLAGRLYRKGLVTHMMPMPDLSGFHAYNALRTEHWDSLEKALTVFKLPLTSDVGNGPKLHRRVDLVFAVPASYWTAVIGWSGSKMFQRDLRLWAKQERGMKFDSNGLTRRHDTRLFLPKSEKEVFDILGLDWINPTMRNADG